MAVVTPPLFLDVASTYGAEELGIPYRDLVGEGVIGSGDLAVSQRAAGANLSVDVAAGVAWIVGDDNASTQPCYRAYNDATVNLAVSAGDATHPRKDLVVAEVLDSTFGGSASDLWRLRVVEGTPAASPAEPSLPNNALKLAILDVVATETAIQDSDITDTRQPAGVGAGDAGGMPAGTILPWAGTTAPWGFLLADGTTSHRRAQYVRLFAQVGTTFGNDDSDTFGVPDLRGRTIIGLDNLGGSSANRVTDTDADTLGGADGAETHTLSDAEMPSHDHAITVDAQTDMELFVWTGSGTAGWSAVGQNGRGSGNTISDDAVHGLDHGHTASASTAGSDAAHNNMQPFIALGYIIKT